MSAVCPNGHDSESTDYCDTCGAPIPPGATATPPPAAAPASGGNSLDLPPAPGPKECPNCGTPNVESSLFCEACGYDFTTGALPAGARSVESGLYAAPAPETSAPAAESPAPPVEPEAPDWSAPDAGEEPGAGAESGTHLDASEPEASESGIDPDGAAAEAAAELAGNGADPSLDPDAGDGIPAPEAGDPLGGEAAAPEPATGLPAPSAYGGADPNVPPRIAFQWVAEVWIDPEWYADQQAEEPLPSAGLPIVVPLRVASALIGRESASRQIHPDIDCSADPGVSRRHAQLTTDGSRWFVEDLQSSNGTFVGPAFGPLPKDPIAVGPKTEVGDNRVYVGAWTRIVVRRATDEEIAIG